MVKFILSFFMMSVMINIATNQVVHAQDILQVKKKKFVIKRQANESYQKGDKKRFYDEAGKLALIGTVIKYNKNLCLFKIDKFRRGLSLKKGMKFYLTKDGDSANALASQNPSKSLEEPEAEETPVETQDKENKVEDPSGPKYLVKAGLGGQNSASVFAELDIINKRPWTYGLVLSSRIVGRDDVELSSMSYGDRVDYNFKDFFDNGFLMSLNLGMASLTYDVVAVEGITSFTLSESVPYGTVIAGYRLWFKKLLLTFGGGISYMGYSASLEDPVNDTVVTNPYVTVDLALEISLGFTF